MAAAAAIPFEAEISAVASAVENARSSRGQSIPDLVSSGSVLLVFLRHAGCTFCREAVSDIARVRSEIEDMGIRIVLVHMGDRERIDAIVRRHGLEDVDRICDSSQSLYEAFGLKKGTWGQLAGPKVWARGVLAGLRGHGVSRPMADASQMPGVFLIEKGLVVRSYRHRSAADRPAYADLCEIGGSEG